MTVQDALRQGTQALRAGRIDDPAVEAGVLLRHALHQSRAFLYAHLPDDLTQEQESSFLDLLRRRLDHRPTAYLIGVREFYGIEFYVGPGVLIPRPETEMLVEESLRQLAARSARGRTPVFVDVGTGSGAIALAVAHHWPNARIFATDQSPAALQIASLNAKRPHLAGRVEFLHGDLLNPVPVEADVVAANLPYVRTADWARLPPEIRDHEPREALDGGDDGLEIISRFVMLASEQVRSDGTVILEVGSGQSNAVLALLASGFPTALRYVRQDLAGIERIVVADRARGELPAGAMVR